MASGGNKQTSSNLLKVGTLTLKPDDLHPNGVVVVGDKLVIADSQSYKVHVYRRHDGKLLSSTDRLESSPIGLCRVSDTELCVAMTNGSIAIMSVQDSDLISRGKTFDLRPSFKYCHGVTLWNDNIVVSGENDNTICWCVVSLKDGRPYKLHKVCGGWLSSLTVKQDMVYISCNSKSDDDSGVYGFNLLNPSQPTYKYKHEELLLTQGITVDDIGHLFVCDWSSSIFHLTGKCQLVAIYKNDIPREPLAIFCDSGVLYLISCESNVITKYKTPHQGPAISAKAMIKVDREDQKEKISPLSPVEQVTQRLRETGIHESILMQLSKDLICKDWRFFFRALSVKDEEMEEIEFDNRHYGVREQIYQLLRFSNKKGILKKASLIEALKKIHRFDLVTKYRKEKFPES